MTAILGHGIGPKSVDVPLFLTVLFHKYIKWSLEERFLSRRPSAVHCRSSHSVSAGCLSLCRKISVLLGCKQQPAFQIQANKRKHTTLIVLTSFCLEGKDDVAGSEKFSLRKSQSSLAFESEAFLERIADVGFCLTCLNM